LTSGFFPVSLEDMKYLFFDTETTGLPRNYNLSYNEVDNWPRLVQLAFVLSQDGEVLEQASYIIKPRGFTIPEKVIKIHGIDNLLAQREGVEIEKAISHFLELALDEEIVFVGHNFHFDKNILGAELVRLKIDASFFERPHFCTMTSQSRFLGKYPKLSDLHLELFGRDFANAHSALSDTLACHDCFFELRKRNRI
jgi:DNA polymerase III subunit epsilon